jgi:hypothetical protein
VVVWVFRKGLTEGQLSISLLPIIISTPDISSEVWQKVPSMGDLNTYSITLPGPVRALLRELRIDSQGAAR